MERVGGYIALRCTTLLLGVELFVVSVKHVKSIARLFKLRLTELLDFDRGYKKRSGLVSSRPETDLDEKKLKILQKS